MNYGNFPTRSTSYLFKILLVICCLKGRVTKRYKANTVNIYASKIFFYSKDDYFQGPPPIFRAIYIIKDAHHKPTI